MWRYPDAFRDIARAIKAPLGQKTSMNNLFAEIPASLPDELVQTLAESAAVRIERIVSHGHASPAGFWYDQPQREWVVLLRGAARLIFEQDARLVEMRPGDWISIAAHARHRVESTDPHEPTIWLAVHFAD